MRLPNLTYEGMSPRQRESYDRIVSSGGHTTGPHIVWLYSPDIGDRAEALLSFARSKCSLPKKLREFSILVTSRYWDAQYSWNGHTKHAIDAGINPETVKAIAEKRPPVFHADDERVFFNFATELLENHFVSDKTFKEAQALFGDQGIVDIIGSVGSFSMLAMLLNAFQVDLQANREPPFPDIKGFEKCKNIPQK